MFDFGFLISRSTETPKHRLPDLRPSDLQTYDFLFFPKHRLPLALVLWQARWFPSQSGPTPPFLRPASSVVMHFSARWDVSCWARRDLRSSAKGRSLAAGAGFAAA